MTIRESFNLIEEPWIQVRRLNLSSTPEPDFLGSAD